MSSKSDWRLWVTVLYGLGLGIIPLSAGAETGAPPASQKVTAPASDLPALYEQAQQAQQKGEQDKAIALLTQILERDPQQIEAYEARASLYEKQKRSELAMADYRKIIALDPKHTGAQGNLGWLLILDNRFDEAREATEKAHALAPDDYAWLFNLGHLALFAGQQEQARTYYRQALERIPSTEGFEQSIVADFDLFIQKGWQVEKIKQALAWARETFAPRKNWLDLQQKALEAYQRADYSTAEKTLRSALEIADAALGPNHPDVAKSLINLALLYHVQDRYTEAEPLYQRALAIQEKYFGYSHPNIVDNIHFLANFYQKQERYDDAESLYQRALTIRENTLGLNHPAVAESLEKLGIVYSVLNRFSDAESLYQRSLAIREKFFGSNHLETAKILTNIAMLYRDEGRQSEALPLLYRVLSIQEDLLGPNYFDVALTLNNLALFYIDIEANLSIGEIKNYAKNLIKKTHSNREIIFEIQGVRYNSEEKFIKVDSFLQRALFILEKSPKNKNFEVAAILNNFAALYQVRGEYDKAAILLQRSLNIYENSSNPNHSDVSANLNNLAELYRTQGRPTEAEPLYRRTLGIIEQHDLPASLLLYSRNFGRFLVERGRLEEALAHYRVAVDALDRLFNQTRGLSEEARHTFLGKYAYVYREFLELLLKLHAQDATVGHDQEFLSVASRNQSRLFSELLRQGDETVNSIV